jgi:membrane-associated phospholipid phosphatase
MPWTFYIGMSVLFLVTWNGSIALLLILALLVSLINDVGLKHAFENYSGSARPNPPCDGCSTFSNCSGDVTNTSGMPSGHSCLMTFLTCFSCLYAYNSYRKNKHVHGMGRYILSVVLMATVAGVVMWTRNAEGCHSAAQIGVGSAVGFAAALFYYFVFRLYINKQSKFYAVGTSWRTLFIDAYSPFFGHEHDEANIRATRNGAADASKRALLSSRDTM